MPFELATMWNIAGTLIIPSIFEANAAICCTRTSDMEKCNGTIIQLRIPSQATSTFPKISDINTPGTTTKWQRTVNKQISIGIIFYLMKLVFT